MHLQGKSVRLARCRRRARGYVRTLPGKGSFAILGRFDVVDFVEAGDPKQIERTAMIIRAYGHSIKKRRSQPCGRIFKPILLRVCCSRKD
jgi:uncharacterized protein with GYD domain